MAATFLTRSGHQTGRCPLADRGSRVARINRRIAALTRTSVKQGEPLHILRYRPGQQYHPHNDWLPPPNRRVMTALIYLNDEYQGGETFFAETGLKVKGRKGDALVFVSALANGDLDPLTSMPDYR